MKTAWSCGPDIHTRHGQGLSVYSFWTVPHLQNTHLCLENIRWFLEHFCQFFTQEESVSLTLKLLQDAKQSTGGGDGQQIDLKNTHQYALAH